MKTKLLSSDFALSMIGASTKTKITISVLMLLVSTMFTKAQETWTGSLTGTNQWGNTGCNCTGEFAESYSLSVSSIQKLYEGLNCNSSYQGSATFSGTESVTTQNSFPAFCQLTGSSVNITDSLVVNVSSGSIQLTSLSANPLIPGHSILPISGSVQDAPIYNLELHVNSLTPTSVSGTWDAPGSNSCSVPHGTFFIQKVNSLPGAGITVQNEIINNSSFPYPKILWTGTTNQTAAILKICADGSTATKIIYTNSGVNLNDIHFQIASDPAGNYPNYSGFVVDSIYGNKKIATLNHPTYLSYWNTPYREDTILIVNNNNICNSFKIPIRIYPAPIITVHGLWSSSDVFQTMEQDIKADLLLPSSLILSANYEASNDASFYTNKDVVPDNITTVLMSARSHNYSAGKVDIVCHSMGGNLSRLYLQSYAYQQKRDIHKLITINTPHSGSQLANILLNPNSATSAVARVVAEPAIKLFTLSTNSSIYNGGVENLRIDSYAMDYLNFTKLNNSVVPSHSIITQNQVSNDNLFYLIFAAAGALNFMTPTSFSNYLFTQNSNDMVVTASSQSGGLPWASKTTIQNQSHNGSPKNSGVINEVINALTTNSNDVNYFCQDGYAPVSQETHYRSGPDTSSLHLIPGSLSINYPTQNQSFNPGDIIPINISSSNGINKIILESINLASNSGVLDTAMSNGTINYTVPSDAFGSLEFITFGFDSHNMIAYDTVKINITQTASLDSLSVYGETIYVQEHKTASVSVTSYFNNGFTYNVGNLPDVHYQIANENLAKYDGYNLIKGLKIGTTMLTVSYLGKTKTIPVVVIPEDLSEVDFVSSVNENKHPENNSSVSEMSNVNVFPNPFNSVTTIQYETLENNTVSVKVYDIRGNMVKDLLDAKQTAGDHKINFDGSSLPGGIYIVSIRTANQCENKKLLLIK